MRLLKPAALVVCLVACLVGLPRPAVAQGPPPPPPPPPMGVPLGVQQSAPARNGVLILTIVDPLGAVIPNASVVLLNLEAPAATTAPVTSSSNDKGIATITNLAPGRYSVKAEFPGFEAGLLKETRVRAGENRVSLVLPLKRMEDSVTVTRDAQEAAADRSLAFGSALTREQIELLSDDPEEMRRQLMSMAGPDAVLKVDSFEGQDLPPKAQIKSIRISRDQFAAENHGEFSSIDIVTQAGVGPLRTNLRSGFYDSSLDGQNPLVPQTGPAQNRNFGGSISGTLIKNKMDVILSISGTSSYSTPTVYASTPSGGTVAQSLNTRAPSNNVGVSANINYALTKDQTLRVSVGSNASESGGNLGVQDYPDRAYSTNSTGYFLRASQVGPIGRRFFTSTRFSLNWQDSESESVAERRTYVVLDEFTSGGAQRKGGVHNRVFTYASDLDYVRGRHSLRVGLQMDGGRYRTDTSTNYHGTYTFESLEAFNEGRPRSYTQRVGDPTVEYWNVQTALFIQDDFRPRKNLSLSYGLRYEIQTHVDDPVNIAPRAGLTWSPFTSGRTTVRASWGIFYDWFSMGTYSQVLQSDGTHQQEVNLNNPTFPDPGPLTPTGSPTNRYLLDPNLRLPGVNRVSAGVSQTLSTRVNVGSSYSYSRREGLLIGENLNTPVDGVRPDPRFANLIRAMSLAASRAHMLSVYMNLNLGRVGAANTAAARAQLFDWRRGLNVSMYPYLTFNDNNTDGAFAVPATGDLNQEWGASGSRGFLQMNLGTSMLRNLNVYFYLSQNGRSPLTVRTGFDNNGDLIFNDRPEGVGRGTERVPGTFNSSLNFNYNFGLGSATTTQSGGVMITSSGVGGLTAQAAPSVAAPRYRINIGVSVDNPLNRPNYTGYSNVQSSTKFMQPTQARGVRTVRFNAGIIF